jgi:hypothetical protein
MAPCPYPDKWKARSAPHESCRSFQLFHHPVDNRTCKRPFDHSERTRHKIFLVETWIAATIGRTTFIHAAAILFQKRTRRATCYPRVVMARLRADQISLNELFTRYLKTPRQPVNFLFAKRGPHLLAAVRALSTVDPRPHAPCRGKDTLINLFRLQPALALQESAEAVILFLFSSACERICTRSCSMAASLPALASLLKISRHPCSQVGTEVFVIQPKWSLPKPPKPTLSPRSRFIPIHRGRLTADRGRLSKQRVSLQPSHRGDVVRSLTVWASGVPLPVNPESKGLT